MQYNSFKQSPGSENTTASLFHDIRRITAIERLSSGTE